MWGMKRGLKKKEEIKGEMYRGYKRGRIIQIYTFYFSLFLSLSMTIAGTLRRISTQLQNLSKKHSHWHRSSHGKTVTFYSIDSIFYTHSSAEYDRTPSEKSLPNSDDEDHSQSSEE